MRILIIHSDNYHYEIVPSIIELFPEKILNIRENFKNIEFIIGYNYNNKDFEEYILETYKNVKFNKLYQLNFEEYDYIIYDSVYINRKKIEIKKDSLTEYYILHEICEEYNNIKNVIYLTPLSKKNSHLIPYILPYNNYKKIKTEIPILIIQGEINRRDFTKLSKLMEKFKNREFIVKIIGKSIDRNIPTCLLKYKEKIIYKPNLSYIDYHKEFLDIYAIMPLVEPSFNKKYFQNKLTSSISYGIGYNLKFFCFESLKIIYNIENCLTYINDIEMYENFDKLLNQFVIKSV
jgi:hypothetical protein